jgi:hypothetical protein
MQRAFAYVAAFCYERTSEPFISSGIRGAAHNRNACGSLTVVDIQALASLNVWQ